MKVVKTKRTGLVRWTGEKTLIGLFPFLDFLFRRNLHPAFNESFDLKLEEERWVQDSLLQNKMGRLRRWKCSEKCLKREGGGGGPYFYPIQKCGMVGRTFGQTNVAVALENVKAERALSRFGKILFLTWSIYGQYMTFFQGWSGKNHPNIAAETSPDLCG